MKEIEQIDARLAQIEKAIASAYWAAHMGSERWKPVPAALYEERRRLRDRRMYLQNLNGLRDIKYTENA